MTEQPGLSWVPMNDLGRALADERADILEAVAEVLDSGWLVHGPQHRAFEQEAAAYLGVDHVLGLGNGTDALELAMRAAMPEGRSVVVTAANCGGYATTAARRAGFDVVYADVDPETLCLDPASLEAVVDDSVGVVVVTHLYGRAADVPAVRAVSARHGARVLEDCAQAIGAQWDGARVGSLGDVASFSFYPTKNLGAVGDGGAVATNDAGLAERVRVLRQYGWTAKYTIGEDGGRNSRLDEVQAAVLRRRLRRLDAWNERRREIVAAYVRAAGPGVRVLPAEGPGHVAHLAVVVCQDRDAVRAHLERAGVRTDVHYPVPDHRQPALAARYQDVALPVTEQAAAQILSVPVFAEMTEPEVRQVCDALAGC